MLDEITGETGGWGLPRRPVVADAGYGRRLDELYGLT
jgi:hypothetical protein